ENHNWQYGKEILMFTIATGMALGQAGNHDAAAAALVQPVVDKIQGDWGLRGTLVTTLLSMGNGMNQAPALSLDNEHNYATWKSGTIDFIIQPLPYDDEALTVSKMLGIWDQPMADEIASSGMEHAMLGWGGPAHTLVGLLKAFVVI